MSADRIVAALVALENELDALPAEQRKHEAMFALGWVVETCYENGVSSAEVLATELSPPGKARVVDA